jgi:hypothetical protein
VHRVLRQLNLSVCRFAQYAGRKQSVCIAVNSLPIASDATSGFAQSHRALTCHRLDQFPRVSL